MENLQECAPMHTCDEKKSQFWCLNELEFIQPAICKLTKSFKTKSVISNNIELSIDGKMKAMEISRR